MITRVSTKSAIDRLAGVLVTVELTSLLWAERRWPLRRRAEPGSRRVLRNFAFAALAGAFTGSLERPLVGRLSGWVARRRLGLLHCFRLPATLELAVGVAAMDYTLYVWHVLTHRVPALWRLHRVHHADLDLDTSTALRFHFLELMASVPWRMAQVRLLGIKPTTLSVWQMFLMLSILFHHSNLRLPRRVESVLARLIMTPRLHGIHHSSVEAERDSNWSSGLMLWDQLHGTLRTDPPQGQLRIGVEGVFEPSQVKLWRMLLT